MIIKRLKLTEAKVNLNDYNYEAKYNGGTVATRKQTDRDTTPHYTVKTTFDSGNTYYNYNDKDYKGNVKRRGTSSYYTTPQAFIFNKPKRANGSLKKYAKILLDLYNKGTATKQELLANAGDPRANMPGQWTNFWQNAKEQGLITITRGSVSAGPNLQDYINTYDLTNSLTEASATLDLSTVENSTTSILMDNIDKINSIALSDPKGKPDELAKYVEQLFSSANLNTIKSNKIVFTIKSARNNQAALDYIWRGTMLKGTGNGVLRPLTEGTGEIITSIHDLTQDIIDSVYSGATNSGIIYSVAPKSDTIACPWDNVIETVTNDYIIVEGDAWQGSNSKCTLKIYKNEFDKYYRLYAEEY